MGRDGERLWKGRWWESRSRLEVHHAGGRSGQAFEGYGGKLGWKMRWHRRMLLGKKSAGWEGRRVTVVGE